MSTSTRADLRTDWLTGVRTFVVDSRQDRPNLPAAGCPFCPGGLEAPETYDVRWFPNRWPAMPDDRCEVVLYTPQHDATFWSLGVEGARRVIDLWAERTAALGARPDVEYVLVFENRGAAVGATITHPHGQIYAFEFVPELPRRELLGGDEARRAGRPARRRVAGLARVGARGAVFPYALRLVPDEPVPDLPSLDRRGPRRRWPAARRRPGALRPAVRCGDAVHALDPPAPVRRRATGRTPGCTSRSSRRGARRGVTRYVAAGELGSGVYFNPVAPEAAAQSLRDAV